MLNILVRQELSLHLVSVNIGQVMEHVLAKVGGYFVRLAETAKHLLCFVKAVIATKSLPLTLGILLQQQWRGSHLVDGLAAAHADRHAALLAV